MSQLNHECEPFSLENQSWENLFNNFSDHSEGDKEIFIPKMGEEKEKKQDRGVTKKGKMKVENEKKKKREKTSDNGTHILTERERRKKMRIMFSNLHSLLPQLPPKADKSTVVDEAVSYIKTLQCTLKRLQKQKLEKLAAMANDKVSSMNNNPNNPNNNNNSISAMAKTSTNFPSSSASQLPVIIQTWTSSNMVLNICGNDAQFTVYTPKKPQLFTTLCSVLEKHKLEVVSAHISSEIDRCVYMIQARVADNRTCDQLSGLMTVAEIYKQAAAEMMLWVSP